MSNQKKNTNSADSVSLHRVSKSHDEDLDLSLKAQSALLASYTAKEVLNEREAFTIKEGASDKWQRNKFKDMMDYVQRNDIKNIVVEKVDRLTRNFKDMVMIDDWLDGDDERKVHFVKDSFTLSRRSKSHDKLNWGIRVVIAKGAIDNLREEVEKGVSQKLIDGWLPGTPPPGYVNIGKEGQKTQVVNKKVAPLTQKMFELYLEPAQSLSTLTKVMEERGMVSKFGRPIGRSHLRKLLGNRYYIGELWWSGKSYGKGNHVPLINKEVFEAVQRKLENKSIPKSRKHDPLLRGLITCEECSSLITWEQKKGSWYGRCRNLRKNCSRRKYLKQTDIEQQLYSRFDDLLAPSPDIAAWAKEAIQLRHENDMEAYYASINSLKQRHTDLARRIDLAYDDRADGRISVEKYDAKVAQWEAEQEAIVDQLGEFDDTYHARLAHNLNILELSQRAKEIYNSKDTHTERRSLIAEIFSNLTMRSSLLEGNYTELMQIVANKAADSRKLKSDFELSQSGSVEPLDANNMLKKAYKSQWLGLWSDYRTLQTAVNPISVNRVKSLLAV